MRLVEPAPAKINLFLHVGPPGADGYHPLASLMAFTDIGDLVTLEESDTPGFVIDGPFAAGLDAGPGNLLLRARDAFLAAAGIAAPGFRLTLTKTLPVASGLGGGSADAAAVLRLLKSVARPDLTPEAWDALTLSLGADVPACFGGLPVMARGRGERLSDPPWFDDLHAVLVNPGVASSTPAVFTAYDQGRPHTTDAPDLPEVLETFDDVLEALTPLRNDLEAPAISLVPEIGQALAALRDQKEARLVRMTGSGATCFALTETADLARRLGSWIDMEHPDWWVRPCRIRGSFP